MKSKDFAILVKRLEKEIARNKNLITKIQLGRTKANMGEREIVIAKNYVNYHEEIIRFIKRLDKELAEENPSSSTRRATK